MAWMRPGVQFPSAPPARRASLLFGSRAVIPSGRTVGSEFNPGGRVVFRNATDRNGPMTPRDHNRIRRRTLALMTATSALVLLAAPVPAAAVRNPSVSESPGDGAGGCTRRELPGRRRRGSRFRDGTRTSDDDRAARFSRRPGKSNVAAFDVNDRGQVVGCYADVNGTYHGFRYDKGQFTLIDDDVILATALGGACDAILTGDCWFGSVSRIRILAPSGFWKWESARDDRWFGSVRVLPHSAFRGQTPDEMYFGTGDAVPADLRSPRPPRAGHAWKQTARRRTRHARQSTRPRDPGVLTAVPTTGPPLARASGGEARRTGNRTSHEEMRKTVSGITVVAR